MSVITPPQTPPGDERAGNQALEAHLGDLHPVHARRLAAARAAGNRIRSR